MAIIGRMLKKAFGAKMERRILMMSLDAAGKTSLLYRWKLGEVVTSIPTIGFNVETIEYNNVEFTIWDVGGCDKIRPLFRHYFAGTSALVMVVDANDRERMDELRTDFVENLMQDEQVYGVPVLVVRNKIDLPNAQSANEIVEALGLLQNFAARPWRICSCSATSGEGVVEVLEQLKELLQADSAAEPRPAPEKPQEVQLYRAKQATSDNSIVEGDVVKVESKSGKFARVSKAEDSGVVAEMPFEQLEKVDFRNKAQRRAEGMSSLFIGWLRRDDEPDDVFLGALRDYSLDSWDHYTHLRLAWILLGRHGRKEGMRQIFEAIKNFIENSDRTKRGSGRGTTFHVTMTYFWVNMVDFAMKSSTNPTDDFKGFLLTNPVLVNGGLFLHYYSKKLMLMTAESRTQVVLPDKRPLPSIVSDIEQMKKRVASGLGVVEPLPVATEDPPEEFLGKAISGALASWSHSAYLRVVYESLSVFGRQRGKENVFRTIRYVEGVNFHFSLCYFWIHMVSLAMSKEGMDPRVQAQMVRMPWSTFQMSQGYLNSGIASNELYKKFYSDELLFNADGGSAAQQMVLPDKAPLPQFI